MNNLCVFEVTQKLQLVQLFGGENMLPTKFIHSAFVVSNREKWCFLSNSPFLLSYLWLLPGLPNGY
jgi:hypothetical protein